jgi:hypothetical protein
MLAEKEESYAKTGERRCRDKEDQMLSFVELQRKTLEI